LNGHGFASVEPRVHLADLLRDRLHHRHSSALRTGVCGACALWTGRARASYAVLCAGAGHDHPGLDDDPVVAVLHRAFTAEHGLQCGFCTPAMLITARDSCCACPTPKSASRGLSGNLPLHRLRRHRPRRIAHAARISAR
jgi:carbon-monoxide dehydrogenase small subunit